MIPKEMIEGAARAGKAKREELIAQPLARVWPEIMEAALNAALSSQWRGIESAPKDGEEILIGCFSRHGANSQFVVFWDGDPKSPTYPWQTADGIAYHKDLPTHWQPLSPPPITHKSDCATNNAPALPPGPCDCGAEK